MFARLRGVRERDVAAAVKSIIRAVSIGSCAANLIKTYRLSCIFFRPKMTTRCCDQSKQKTNMTNFTACFG